MNFLANITEAVGGLFANAPSSSAAAGRAVLPSALIADHGEIGGVMSLSVFDPQAMFDCYRLMVDSATSQRVLSRERQKLVITQTQIVLLTPLPVRAYSARVSETHELQALAKLKFHKGSNKAQSNASESTNEKAAPLALLVLELKNNKSLSYAMSDAHIVAAVDLLKKRMSALGITGSVTRPLATRRILQNATQCLAASQEIQTQFSLAPSRALIEEMMSLLRTATELYGTVGESHDALSQRCVDEIHRFLERDDVRAVLEERETQTLSQTQTQTQTQRNEPAAQSLIESASAAVPSSATVVTEARALTEVLTETQTEFDAAATPHSAPTQPDFLVSEEEMKPTRALPHPLAIEVEDDFTMHVAETAQQPAETCAADNTNNDDDLTRSVLKHMDVILSPERLRERAREHEALRAMHVNAVLFDCEEDLTAQSAQTEHTTQDSCERGGQREDPRDKELDALFEEMDLELRQLTGSTSAPVSGSLSGAATSNEYDDLGLEDFERLINEI